MPAWARPFPGSFSRMSVKRFSASSSRRALSDAKAARSSGVRAIPEFILPPTASFVLQMVGYSQSRCGWSLLRYARSSSAEEGFAASQMSAWRRPAWASESCGCCWRMRMPSARVLCIVGEHDAQRDDVARVAGVARCRRPHACDGGLLAGPGAVERLIVGQGNIAIRRMIAIKLLVDAHGVIEFALPAGQVWPALRSWVLSALVLLRAWILAILGSGLWDAIASNLSRACSWPDRQKHPTGASRSRANAGQRPPYYWGRRAEFAARAGWPYPAVRGTQEPWPCRRGLSRVACTVPVDGVFRAGAGAGAFWAMLVWSATKRQAAPIQRFAPACFTLARQPQFIGASILRTIRRLDQTKSGHPKTRFQTG